MTIQLPPLPYPAEALSPHISERTIDFHYGKHHAGYVANLNRMIGGSEHAGEILDDIIRRAAHGPLLNNAAQVWNHNFYWSSMSPDGGGDPTGDLATAVEASFGSIDSLRKELADAAVSNFGSGWTWLVRDDSGLSVVNTDDADTPLRHGQRPLLTVDVWEHAYYLDYQNARQAYVETWIEHLVNWDFAATNNHD